MVTAASGGGGTRVVALSSADELSAQELDVVEVRRVEQLEVRDGRAGVAPLADPRDDLVGGAARAARAEVLRFQPEAPRGAARLRRWRRSTS